MFQKCDFSLCQFRNVFLQKEVLFMRTIFPQLVTQLSGGEIRWKISSCRWKRGGSSEYPTSAGIIFWQVRCKAREILSASRVYGSKGDVTSLRRRKSILAAGSVRITRALVQIFHIFERINAVVVRILFPYRNTKRRFCANMPYCGVNKHPWCTQVPFWWWYLLLQGNAILG